MMALFVAAFFAPVLSSRYHLPRGGGDLVSFLFPMHRFIAFRYRAGDLPLWNPHQDAGWPIGADVQAGLFYPPQVLLWLLRPEFGYDTMQALVILHVLAAGIALYACLRLWRASERLRVPAALIGAVVWMFNDVFITHLGNLNFVAVAVWWPLALLGLHRAIQAATVRSRTRWLLVGAVALAVGTSAGHAQVTWLGIAILGMYGLWRAIVSPPSGTWSRSLAHSCVRTLGLQWHSRAHALGLLVAMCLLGAALAAVVIVPAALNTPHSARAAFDYAASVEFSAPPRGLIGLFAPGVWGRGVDAFRGPWDRVELGYIGVLPWLLAAVAIVGRRPRSWAFWALLAAVGLLLSVGDATPFHRIVLGPLELPFRAPARYLMWTNFGVAWLAALGIDHLLRIPLGQGVRRTIRRVAWGGALAATIIVGWGAIEALADPTYAVDIALSLAIMVVLAAQSIALLVGYARGALSSRRLSSAAVLLVAIDLIALGMTVEIQREDPAQGFAVTPVVDVLVGEHHSVADATYDGSLTADERNARGPWRVDFAGGSIQPGAAQVHGLHGLGGVYNPLRVATFDTAMDALGMRGSPLYDLFGVRWIVTAPGDAPTDLASEPMTRLPLVDPAADLWRNDEAVPRLLVLGNVEWMPDSAAALDRVRAADFDPHTTVVLEDDGSRAARRDRATGGAPMPAQGQAHFLHYGSDELSVAVTATQASWLVIGDVWHPGWTADVGGEPAPVARANFTFRAVPVPAGEHTVTMRFEPPGWRLATAASLAAWLLVAVAAVATVKSVANSRR